MGNICCSTSLFLPYHDPKDNNNNDDDEYSVVDDPEFIDEDQDENVYL